MTIASGQNVTISMKAESTYATAATGNYDLVPFSSESLTLSKTNYESGIIAGDREVRDIRMGSHSVSGDISFDLSYQATYITMLQALLGVSAQEAGGDFAVGSVRNSFSFQKSFETDLAGSDDVHLFTGLEVNSFALTVPADGLVTGSFSFVGANMTTEDALVGTDVTYTDANNPFHSSEVTITEGGSSQSIITDLSLTIENGIATANIIGSTEPIQGGIGKCRVTGSLTAHFTSGALYEKFVANTSTSLLISMGATTTGLSISLPEVLYTTGVVNVGGEGLISVTMDFVAMRDDATDVSAITIDANLT